MSAVSQTEGFAQLQIARSEALAKVDEARSRRAKRLKEAKDEAKVEVDVYKNEQDIYYQNLEQELTSKQVDIEETSKLSTATQLLAISQGYNRNKEAALEILVAATLNVQPVLHVNYRQEAA